MPYSCDACGKTFRYKVTQRTHKCQPGKTEVKEEEEVEEQEPATPMTPQFQSQEAQSPVGEQLMQRLRISEGSPNAASGGLTTPPTGNPSPGASGLQWSPIPISPILNQLSTIPFNPNLLPGSHIQS